MSMVPKLRFPEFDGEWKNKNLEDVFKRIRNGFVGTATPFYVEVGINYIQGKDIKNARIGKNSFVQISEEFHLRQSKSRLSTGDLLMVQSGHVGECAVVERDLDGANCHALIIMTPGSDISSWWLVQYFYSHPGSLQISKIKTGNTVEHILASDMQKMSVPLPSLPEQQKIASFLSAVDKKIDLLRQKKEKLEAYKKGLMQAIFSQEIRFKADDGSDFPDWEEVALSDVLREHKLKSDGSERVHSVSVHKGLVDQVEHLGRSFAAADTGHYNRVLPGDVVYTKSPTGDFPMGIIKQNHLQYPAIVSPLYGVFTPETEELGYILHSYFESPVNVGNYLSPLVQKGAKNTIAVTNTRFLEGQLLLPRDRNEQAKIATALRAVAVQINLHERILKTSSDFKKGLLQQMFV